MNKATTSHFCKKQFLPTVIFLYIFLCVGTLQATNPSVERWGVFSIELKGPATGNPFTDVQLSATFSNKKQTLAVPGFYNGNGNYIVRFSPDKEGTWTYQTTSNVPELSGQAGRLVCVRPTKNNHGPVRIFDTYYFKYADGTPYFSVGTTCYQWISQSQELQEQTMKTLAEAPFNKLRMCLFPKWYIYNRTEPANFAYQHQTDSTFDFTKFNPTFWNNVDKRVAELGKLGIQADIVLFHPYDKWGFATMDDAGDDRYIRYAMARLAAYSNVWWSIANEYDFMTVPPRKDHAGNKNPEDWDRFFKILYKEDPFHRPLSIHNGTVWYDHTKPWVSHASIQNSKLENGMELRNKYKKPVVFDECKYEGNIERNWGQLSAKTMTERFWVGAFNGCYVGHGECIKDPNDILWWGKGGKLHGESPVRIAFFRKFMEALPFNELAPSHLNDSTFLLAKPGRVYLAYAVKAGPIRFNVEGPTQYELETVDTWNMTSKKICLVKPGPFMYQATNDDFLLKLTAVSKKSN
jgi:hypothetical protein